MSIHGKVDVEPHGEIVAGSMGSWKITYTVGKYGVDDGGSIVLVRKNICDWEEPQFEDPKASGYVMASTSGDAKLSLSYSRQSFYRPWFNVLRIDVVDGYLKEGDNVTIILGDRRYGGPGMRAQTFQEKEFLFKVLVDPFRTKIYYEVPSPRVSIIGGPAETLPVLVPSIIEINEPFSILVRAVDSWGNPSSTYRGAIGFDPFDGVDGLPRSYLFAAEDEGVQRFDNVKIRRAGIYRFKVEDDAGLTGLSNPLICSEEELSLRLYWGDIHGQTHGKSRGVTSDTVGTGTPTEYFVFARNIAGLDFCSWHGNDFQVSNELWKDVCNTTERFNEPGRFVTFLGYEWSGNTSSGGDHNIYYIEDHQAIYRSSHVLIEDKSDLETDRSPISELWKTFRGRKDVMAVPHVGGRYANFDFYDPEFIRLIEIYSFHGAFEWFAKEALMKGMKVGFIAGSDDHTCRPGIEYSTLLKNKTKGGLAGVYAESVTRNGIWNALWERRCYGTTGARIILFVDVGGHPMGSEITLSKPPKIRVKVHGTGGILEVLIMRGGDVIYRYPTFEPSSGIRQILLMWGGARSKGRDKRTDWDGGMSISKGRILSFKPFAFHKNGLETLTKISNQAISWKSFTLGDYKGVFLKLDAPDDAAFTFHSILKTLSFRLKDVSSEPLAVDAGGIDQKITVREVPIDEGTMDVEVECFDYDVKKGLNPYWVRVQQLDGEIAWSSPVYAYYR